jgi:hypothetical protein
MDIRISTVLIATVISSLQAASATAGECAKDVAEFQQQLERQRDDVGTAPQSVGAQLGHQPTPESVAQAEAKAKTEIAIVLEQAKQFDAEGKQRECMDALAKARLLVHP